MKKRTKEDAKSLKEYNEIKEKERYILLLSPFSSFELLALYVNTFFGI